MTFHSIHDQAMVVFFLPSESKLPNKRTFDVLEFVRQLEDGDDDAVAMARDGGFAIIGDHTQLALKDLAFDFPHNQKWKRLPGEVMFCHRDEESYDMLKSWGILDNVKGQKRTFVSFQSKMESLRTDYLTLCEQADKGSTQFRQFARVLKENRKAEYDMPQASFGQLWQLVVKEEPVWRLLKLIFNGEVANPKAFNKPKSGSIFNLMGGIPDDDLVAMLQPVVAGRKTLKAFTADCKLWKASHRVQTEILRQIADGDDWKEVQGRYPSACADSFVLDWSRWILHRNLKQKQPLPPDFFDMLSKKMEADQKQSMAAAAHASVSVNTSL